MQSKEKKQNQHKPTDLIDFNFKSFDSVQRIQYQTI